MGLAAKQIEKEKAEKQAALDLSALMDRIETLSKENERLDTICRNQKAEIDHWQDLEGKAEEWRVKYETLTLENKKLAAALRNLEKPMNERLQELEEVAKVDLSGFARQAIDAKKGVEQIIESVGDIVSVFRLHWIILIVVVCAVVGVSWYMNYTTKKALNDVQYTVNAIWNKQNAAAPVAPVPEE